MAMRETNKLYDAIFTFLLALAAFATLVFCLIGVMTVLFTNGGAL
jgi:hypothetical protein